MKQLSLPWPGYGPAKLNIEKTERTTNRVMPADAAIHDWYRFVLSFPPHLVRDYVQDFRLDGRHTILDPFCGTGTTLVESRLMGTPAIGIEANPFAHFASSVKVNWDIDPDSLMSAAQNVAKAALETLLEQGIDDNWPYTGSLDQIELESLDDERKSLLLDSSISPLPLHKILVLLRFIRKLESQPFCDHLLLALAKTLVFSASNLHFGPEVGVKKSELKVDTPVIHQWLSAVTTMAHDLRLISTGQEYPHAEVHLADARYVDSVIEHESVDAVITSPPYPNEKDYTRTTRLESVVLGFINSRAELRAFKKRLLRSNTRGVYNGDDDDVLVLDDSEIQVLSDLIEKRRVELGKTSGFERLYARVARLYFGGMKRHFAALRPVLRPGARLAYVVGDQASYLRVMIRTGDLLAGIAQTLGYKIIRKDLFRTRFSTTTKEQLREEVIVMLWPG